MKDLQVFVIHVKGAKAREVHIKNELSKFNIKAEFILDGNKEDITNGILDKYFADKMHQISGQTSCALKHIIAYETAIKQPNKTILIFEDDIILRPNFKQIIDQIIIEIKDRKLSNYIVSLENTNHNYVNKKEVITNRLLYKKEHGRCAGAYLLDSECVKSILSEIDKNRCNEPIDWVHNNMSKNRQINIYWSYPHIAEQASHNGKMTSLIDNKKTGWIRQLTYFIQGEIKKRWAPEQV